MFFQEIVASFSWPIEQQFTSSSILYMLDTVCVVLITVQLMIQYSHLLMRRTKQSLLGCYTNTLLLFTWSKLLFSEFPPTFLVMVRQNLQEIIDWRGVSLFEWITCVCEYFAALLWASMIPLLGLIFGIKMKENNGVQLHGKDSLE